MSSKSESSVASRGSAASSTLYVRQSSGLVRAISLPSAVALNISGIGVIWLIFVATTEPAAFPGGSIVWSTVIAGVLALFPILLYGLFGSVMPRAGGDYVYVTRSLHPWLGFAVNFNFVAWILMATAYGASLIAPFSVSAALSALGVSIHSDTLIAWAGAVATPGWTFAFGAIALVLTALLLSFSLRHYIKVVIVLLVLSLVAAAVSIAILLLHGRSDFVQTVAEYGGNYAQIIATAHKAGYGGYGANSDPVATFVAFPLAFGALGYGILTAYMGGEVRNARKTMLTGMVSALVLGTVLGAVLMALADQTFGSDFLGSATSLSNAASKDYPFASPSSFFLFVSLLSHSSVVQVVLMICSIAALVSTLPVGFLIVTRSMFAWSFDRVMPAKFSEVHPRTHSPLVANAVVMVVGLVFLAFLVFGQAWITQLLYTLAIGQAYSFIVIAVAGILFPWRQPHLFKASSVNWSVAGVPVFSLLGLAAAIVYGLVLYLLLTNSSLGANSPVGIKATLVIGAVAIVIWPISYFANRARGVDLGLAFTSLPPE
ncbi:APC family permease [bacterium]|nr:MAG: APC family permease [bacterium]